MDRVTEHLPSSSTVYSLLDNVEGGDQIVIIDSNKDLPENWREQLNELEGKVKLQGGPKKMLHFMEMLSCICRLIPLLSDKVGHFFLSTL